MAEMASYYRKNNLKNLFKFSKSEFFDTIFEKLTISLGFTYESELNYSKKKNKSYFG